MSSPGSRESALPAWVQAILPAPDPELVAPPGRDIVAFCDTCLDGNEWAYLQECLHSGGIGPNAPCVRAFEDAFAPLAGCRHAVACASGEVALHLALSSLGIGPHDEVILPTFSRPSAAHAVRQVGAVPVLVDVEPDTWTPNPEEIEERITSRTRAVLVAHTHGHPADMTPILDLARRHHLVILEDASDAPGAAYGGKPVGSLGDLALFSFHPGGIMTTGEGGMLTTNDRRLAEQVRHSRTELDVPMTGVQAAIGLAQVERFLELVETRRTLAHQYLTHIGPTRGLRLPLQRPRVEHGFGKVGLLVEDEFGSSRDEVREHLARAGIETRPFFIPLHLHPMYRTEFRGQRFPVAERLCHRGLSLPIGRQSTLEDIAYIAERIHMSARVLSRAA